MIDKHWKILLVIILLLGFGLRFYGATTVLSPWDERFELAFTKTISFSPSSLNLPLLGGNSPAVPNYIMKLGQILFGNSLLGSRFIFILLGTATIFLIYFVTKIIAGNQIALLSSFILSLSQFHISTSRIADSQSILIFLVILSLFLFYKGISLSSRKLILINGVVLGIGFLLKETMFLLIIAYLIFLFHYLAYRKWLKDGSLWLSFALAFLIAFPVGLPSLIPGGPRYSYIISSAKFGFSLNAIGLYLGDLILLLMKSFNNLYETAVWQMDAEFPCVNFVLGFLILIAAVTSLKSKKPFIKLLLICFWSNFIIFSFVHGIDRIDIPYSLGCLEWGIIGFIPGILLAVNMLNNIKKRCKFFGRSLIVILLMFMFLSSWNFVSFPLNCVFPNRDFCVRKKLWDWSHYLREKDANREVAKDIFQRIYKVTDNDDYKNIAALRLYQILLQEGKVKESQYYLNYLESQNISKDKLNDPLSLLKNLHWRWPMEYPESPKYPEF